MAANEGFPLSLPINLYIASNNPVVARANIMDSLPSQLMQTYDLVVSDQSSANYNAGLYVFHNQRWQFCIPYTDINDFIIAGGSIDLYLDLTASKTAPSGATVYRNGVKSSATTLTAESNVVWAAIAANPTSGAVAGVASFNGRTGAITLTAADISTAGGLEASNIKGTAKQITATASGSDVTLSLPQDIDNTATVTFKELTLTGSLSAAGAQIAGQLSAAASSGPAGPTNSGISLTASPTWSVVSLFDAGNSANNRAASLAFVNGYLALRFSNDAGNTVVNAIEIDGGQATGVTAIKSTSGSGNWTHSGGFIVNGAISGGVITMSGDYPFASLPAVASSKGMRAFINDGPATATFGDEAAGGGSRLWPVWCDGTKWYFG
jgi:hypothetical protein